MASVVFLRGANVGGARRFLPSELVRRSNLSEYGLVNLGAAGTFVARSRVPQPRLRKALLAELPFETELTVCPGRDLQRLAESDPFGRLGPAEKACLSVLSAKSVRQPTLPHHVPAGSAWEVKLLAVEGPYVFSVYRRLNNRLTYPNPVVEKEFGVPATTRGWSTVLVLARILDEGAPSDLPRKGRPVHGGPSGGK